MKLLDFRCEHCDTRISVRLESSRTMYCWEGEGQDPNRPLALCACCSIEHHNNWDDMWNEYYSGLL